MTGVPEGSSNLYQQPRMTAFAARDRVRADHCLPRQMARSHRFFARASTIVTIACLRRHPARRCRAGQCDLTQPGQAPHRLPVAGRDAPAGTVP
jgi:hypothetical protein